VIIIIPALGVSGRKSLVDPKAIAGSPFVGLIKKPKS
jgi:hypothetical protein